MIFGFGCSGRVEEAPQEGNISPAESTTGTLVFVEKDATKGILRGTYTLEGHEIKFEVIRGEATPPEAMKIYPGVTSHSIDVRLCGAHNFCFINGAGSHSLANDDWIQQDINYEPTSEDSIKNFKSAWGLHNDLDRQATGTFDGLIEEVQILKEATNQPPETINAIPEEYDPYNLKPKTLNQGTPSKSVLSLSATATTYTHILQIWRQMIVVPFAYHSSTYSKSYSSATGALISLYYTCNHGACAGASNIMLYCSRNFTGRSSSALPMYARCSEPATIATYHPSSALRNCCQSMYSYGPLDLSHVCNDDSRIQRDLMIAGTTSVSAPYCSDRYLQGQAPSCW